MEASWSCSGASRRSRLLRLGIRRGLLLLRLEAARGPRRSLAGARRRLPWSSSELAAAYLWSCVGASKLKVIRFLKASETKSMIWSSGALGPFP